MTPSALGVVVAALAIGTTESEAAITVTPVNLPIGSPEALDIAGYGVTGDFRFQGFDDSSFGLDIVKMGAFSGNKIQGSATGGAYSSNYVNRLASGAAVGAGGSAGFVSGSGINNILAFNYSTGSGGGEWLDGETGFIGILVDTLGVKNYGWIEVSTNANNISGTILRYAIESTPDTQIAAGAVGVAAVPEPNSLACLAVGAAGLLRWRQRRKVA